MSGISEAIKSLFIGGRASISRDADQALLKYINRCVKNRLHKVPSWTGKQAIYSDEDEYRRAVEKWPILAPILGFFPGTTVGKAKRKLKEALVPEDLKNQNSLPNIKKIPVSGDSSSWESYFKYLQFKTSRALLPLGYGFSKKNGFACPSRLKYMGKLYFGEI